MYHQILFDLFVPRTEIHITLEVLVVVRPTP
jgi:hypothetical protein